ncbi:YraN family protein [Xylanimonas oleitrophica]|uniref:YraN family protein n=1 Tax=Xylanimonas oleitrophica TaxID=2607479 RepID=UPI0011B72F08|nr:YraN family protein [Xylanimonas oleitrophica]
MAAKDDVGRRGEQIAAERLVEEGYTVLARNWRGTGGELDLVAVHGGTLVAVEVKTRSGDRFGHPAEAVTPRKLARIRRLTGQWLHEHARRSGGEPGDDSGDETGSEVGSRVGHEPAAGAGRWRFRDVRIDVVAVVLPPAGPVRVEVLQGVC